MKTSAHSTLVKTCPASEHFFNQAFTLIELVVIAIISILAALLSPGLRAAREKARAMSCLCNIRQILLADQMYANENNDYLVPYWDHYQSPWTTYKYPGLLQRYIRSGNDTFSQEKDTWLRCPSQQQKDAWGYIIAGIGPVIASGSSSGHLLHGDGVGSDPVSAKRGDLKYPAETPSWMDVDGGSSVGYPAFCRGCYPAGAGYPEPNNFGFRHNNGTNVGFVDGHVTWVPIETMRAPCVQGGADFFRHWDNYP